MKMLKTTMKLKNIVLSLVMACGLLSAVAQDTNKTVNVVNSSDSDKFGREVGISLSTGYAIDNGLDEDYDLNFSAGVQGYLNKFIGAEITIPFFRDDGTLFEEGNAFILARLPIKDTIAIYAGPGVGYNWENKQETYIGKVGAELRLRKNWGIFTEVSHTVDKLDNIKNGSTAIQAGIRLVF